MESGLRTPDPPGETGGLIVMVRSDPAVRPRAIADDLHAELAIGGQETERAARAPARPPARAPRPRRAGRGHAPGRGDPRPRPGGGVEPPVSRASTPGWPSTPTRIRRAAVELQAAEAALAIAVARRSAPRSCAGAAWARAAAPPSWPPGIAVAVVAAPPSAPPWPPPGSSAPVRRAAGRGASSPTSTPASAATARWPAPAGSRWPAPAPIPPRSRPSSTATTRRTGWSPRWSARARPCGPPSGWPSSAAWRGWRRGARRSATPRPSPTRWSRSCSNGTSTELWLTGEPTRRRAARDAGGGRALRRPPEHRARELHRRLLGLPRGQRVIVVLAPDPDAPDRRQDPRRRLGPAAVAAG